MTSQPTRRSLSAIAENGRRRQLAWLRILIDRTGLSRTEIARRAGVSPSTLSKFANDVENIAQLELATISKIEATFHIPLASFDQIPAGAGFTEREAEVYEALGNDPLGSAIKAMLAGDNSRVPWRLATDALAGAGYLRGDVLVVDLNAVPADGDVVCAQLFGPLGASTVFRIFRHPGLLLTAAIGSGAGAPPEMVSQNNVVRGVVCGMLRDRRAVA